MIYTPMAYYAMKFNLPSQFCVTGKLDAGCYNIDGVLTFPCNEQLNPCKFFSTLGKIAVTVFDFDFYVRYKNPVLQDKQEGNAARQ